MTKPIKHCLSLDCPERRSVCCGAEIVDYLEDYRGKCIKCSKPWVGGKCTAGEEDWEKRFDEKFDHRNQSKGFCDSDCTNDYSIDDIKSFIRSLLQKEREKWAVECSEIFPSPYQPLKNKL